MREREREFEEGRGSTGQTHQKPKGFGGWATKGRTV